MYYLLGQDSPLSSHPEQVTEELFPSGFYELFNYLFHLEIEHVPCIVVVPARHVVASMKTCWSSRWVVVYTVVTYSMLLLSTLALWHPGRCRLVICANTIISTLEEINSMQ